jgi:hypothetical protein
MRSRQSTLAAISSTAIRGNHYVTLITFFQGIATLLTSTLGIAAITVAIAGCAIAAAFHIMRWSHVFEAIAAGAVGSRGHGCLHVVVRPVECANTRPGRLRHSRKVATR